MKEPEILKLIYDTALAVNEMSIIVRGMMPDDDKGDEKRARLGNRILNMNNSLGLVRQKYPKDMTRGDWKVADVPKVD